MYKLKNVFEKMIISISVGGMVISITKFLIALTELDYLELFLYACCGTFSTLIFKEFTGY